MLDLFRKHWRYLKYVLLHKWYVFLECVDEGIFLRGLVHDMSKFRPSEWFPYANHFYGRKVRDKTGYYKPIDTGDKAFDFAWLLHQKRNRHHWQWWVLPEDEGGMKILPMSPTARTEMLCDWRGAGMAQGFSNNTRSWYKENRNKMQLHPETRRWVEQRLDILPLFVSSLKEVVE